MYIDVLRDCNLLSRLKQVNRPYIQFMTPRFLDSDMTLLLFMAQVQLFYFLRPLPLPLPPPRLLFFCGSDSIQRLPDFENDALDV